MYLFDDLSLTAFLHGVAEIYGVRVKEVRRGRFQTDGETVFKPHIPGTMSEAEARVWCGSALHEVIHIWRKTPEALTRYVNSKQPDLQKLARLCFNAVVDVNDERIAEAHDIWGRVTRLLHDSNEHVMEQIMDTIRVDGLPSPLTPAFLLSLAILDLRHSCLVLEDFLYRYGLHDVVEKLRGIIGMSGGPSAAERADKLLWFFTQGHAQYELEEEQSKIATEPEKSSGHTQEVTLTPDPAGNPGESPLEKVRDEILEAKATTTPEPNDEIAKEDPLLFCPIQSDRCRYDETCYLEVKPILQNLAERLSETERADGLIGGNPSGPVLDNAPRLFIDGRPFARRESRGPRCATSILIDVSNSMLHRLFNSRTLIEVTLPVAKALVEAICQFGPTRVWAFHTKWSVIPVSSIPCLQTDGMTHLSTPMQEARTWLNDQYDHKRLMLIFTDGLPNVGGDPRMVHEVHRVVVQDNIPLVVFAFQQCAEQVQRLLPSALIVPIDDPATLYHWGQEVLRHLRD